MRKNIENYENYQVLDDGRIWSKNRNKFMKTKNVNGYLGLVLCNNGKSKYFLVHRLVAQAFIPNPNNYPSINHKDENKTNNCVENLEWCTQKYNNEFGTRLERVSKKQINSLQKSKKVYQYTLDGELVKIWPSTKECGRNGYDQGTVAACCRGTKKTYKGYKWSYIPL